MKLEPCVVNLPLWELAVIKVDRATLRSRLGQPHYIETNTLRTFGGEEDHWGYRSELGQRLSLILRVPYNDAVIYADPADTATAIVALAHAIGDSKVLIHGHPYPAR
jgi:hypothetical protein